MGADAAVVSGEDVETPTSGADEHRGVVDESGRADACSDGKQGLPAIPLGHVGERCRVHEHQVVDQGQRLFDEHLAGGTPDRRGTVCRGVRPRLERAAQAERDLTVGLGEVGVAAAHRQAVLLADGRNGNDVDEEVQVAHHAPDEEQLLGVLLAEIGSAGGGEVEQLADDGEHPVEVAGPGLALQDGAERAGRDAHAGVAVGVDDVRGRREHDVDAGIGADGHVGVEGPRIAGEVFLGSELERIEEDRDDDVVVLGPSPAHELGVPVVQGAHGHDDGDISAGEGLPRGPQLVAGAGHDRAGCGARRVVVDRAAHSGLLVARVSSRDSACAGRSRPESRARTAVARARAT